MLEYPNKLVIKVWYYPVPDGEIGECWVNRGLHRLAGKPLKC